MFKLRLVVVVPGCPFPQVSIGLVRPGYDISFQAYWLKLRDEKSCDGMGQWILSNVSRAYGPDSGISFGDLLEQVCEAGCSPSAALRDARCEPATSSMGLRLVVGKAPGMLRLS